MGKDGLMNSGKMLEKCEDVSTIMKSIAHPQRLMMLCHLADGEKNVSELLSLCDISQSQLSQFLTRMQREKLLSARREGNFTFYKIADKRLHKLIQSLQKIFC